MIRTGQKPITVDMISTLIAKNPACRHSAKLDLRVLIKHYGNLKGTELRKKLYCSVCGSREISTSLVYVGGMGLKDD